ncbi:MAG: amidohydrolase family protein [Armatimonadetes bacterium]|nr:amidohydrolase family protein [Armatimonadota bacterium]
MFDLVIKNGIVIDGTGAPGYKADVGIQGDRIAGVGELGSSGARILDAEGCAIAPGFIDIHSHTDELVLANPTCESKLTQGVTTELSGNCGDSAAPRGGRQNLEDNADWLSRFGIEPDWGDMSEFLARLDRLPMSINFATLVGHGTIRAAVVGYDDRPPTEDELAEMCRVAEESVKAGAFGVSSGLIYPPGCYAKTEELIELCRATAGLGGIYATHMRSEAVRLVEAVEESIRIGRESGVGVQISHHKACGRTYWGLVNDSLAVIEKARAEGLDLWADQYPYVATHTGLGIMLPAWAHDGGTPAMLARLKDPEQRHKIREAMLEDMSTGYLANSGGWETVVISGVRDEQNRFCEGLSIAEIAAKLGKHPVDAAIDLLLAENGGVATRGRSSHAGRGRREDDRSNREAARTLGERGAGGRILRRHHGVRSGRDRGRGDIRGAAPGGERSSIRSRQRRIGFG